MQGFFQRIQSYCKILVDTYRIIQLLSAGEYLFAVDGQAYCVVFAHRIPAGDADVDQQFANIVLSDSFRFAAGFADKERGQRCVGFA